MSTFTTLNELPIIKYIPLQQGLRQQLKTD